jgi:hypothetical protein
VVGFTDSPVSSGFPATIGTLNPSAGANAFAVKILNDPPPMQARLSISPTSLTLRSGGSDAGNVSHDVMLRNDASSGKGASIAITAIASSDAQFIPSQKCVGLLAPRAECAVTVRFAPVNKGTHRAKLTITSDDGRGPRSIELVGVAK